MAQLLHELEMVELAPVAASDLAIKLRALHSRVTEIERQQAEEAERNARRNAASNRTR